MTTPWTPDGSWKGQTVAVLAGGPSMSPALAESLREHRTIAVDFACRVAPWADMLVALDGNWAQDLREFAGMRVTGIDDEDLYALYIGHRFERVMLRPGHQIEMRNSALAAVRIAGEMGAKRIILAGLESQVVHIGFAEGLQSLILDLQARRVVVEHAQPLLATGDVVDGQSGWSVVGESGPEMEPLVGSRKKR